MTTDEMQGTKNMMIEDMIEDGACDGLDRNRCIMAMKVVMGPGADQKRTVKKIMGDDNDRFTRQYRRAYENLDVTRYTSQAAEDPAESHESGEADLFDGID